ncbi:MAG: hypothetical protein JWO03_2070 [Bacteroidetes bacterium]|nr:hypothetical protein [Bacteroidota bacterium]
MLKKLLAATCLFVLIGTVRSQSTILVSASDTLRVDTTITSAAGHVIQIFNLRNSSNTDTLQMNWKVTLNTFDHNASWSICDPNLCYASNQVGSVLRYTLLPQQPGIMKFDFIPNCTSADATFRVHTWASNDSANTTTNLTWLYKVQTTCTGVKDIDASQISFYPNPVRNDAHLSIPSSFSNGQIDIYNLIGSKVYSQAVSREKDLDLSSLETGLYIARISENGKVIATRKFTKAE